MPADSERVSPHSIPTAQIYQELADSEPARRALILFRLIAEHPDGRLVLPAREGVGAILDGINLSAVELRERFTGPESKPSWWNAEGQGVDLRHASLRSASLRHADLRNVLFEEADLTEADLVGANLQRATLAGAHLEGALLEDADLRKASLRFAQASHSVLEGAQLDGADLWGAQMIGAELNGASFRGAILEEGDLEGADLRGADLRDAVLKRANLEGANLEGADLRGASLRGANLQGAVLREAQLQGVSLNDCNIAGAHFSDAWLERTRLGRHQLGEAIGDELAGEYESARTGYLALERNFQGLGDHSAESWAYRRRRRMEKREAGRRAYAAYREKRPATVIRFALKYASDQFVEWVCDYGESIRRVLGTLFAVFILMTILYGLTGTVLRIQKTPGGEIRAVTRHPADLALFSLTAATTAGNPPEWLAPRNSLAYVLVEFQGLTTIFLTGLLGFVTGNQIRR